jgi:two-component system chemotaxis sensor kinase CheA
LRDELVPVIDLHKVLDLPAPANSNATRLIVVVEADGERIGLSVDDLLAQQQVVVKSLETNYGVVEGLAGATILGDGSVALILDVLGIAKLSRRRAPQPASNVAA